ncbi:MAG: hypothetical protein U9R51_06295 [Actinomycetota bacterium]|nr:hypothetical protein [Actinomycetota bacterium]
MKATTTLLGALLIVFALAVPAFALEDGIMETTSSTPNEDSTHSDFERVLTNLTEDPIDVAPRDLRTSEYPILTVTSITVGSFDGGIWTIGTLAGGQTASITYTGDAAPAESTTTSTTIAPATTAPASSTTIAPTTTVAPAATTTVAPEELPRTGQRDNLTVFAFTGLALIGLGVSLIRTARD